MAPERILLVDDERPLLLLMRKYLERIGYQVDISERAVQAWELFRSRETDYHLVIVDLTLPDMPGEALLERMMDRRPDLRAVICSGALPASTPDTGRTAQIRYLQKPFLPRMLAEMVAEALAG